MKVARSWTSSCLNNYINWARSNSLLYKSNGSQSSVHKSTALITSKSRPSIRSLHTTFFKNVKTRSPIATSFTPQHFTPLTVKTPSTKESKRSIMDIPAPTEHTLYPEYLNGYNREMLAAAYRYPQEAERLYVDMRGQSILPNWVTLAILLKTPRSYLTWREVAQDIMDSGWTVEEIQALDKAARLTEKLPPVEPEFPLQEYIDGLKVNTYVG